MPRAARSPDRWNNSSTEVRGHPIHVDIWAIPYDERPRTLRVARGGRDKLVRASFPENEVASVRVSGRIRGDPTGIAAAPTPHRWMVHAARKTIQAARTCAADLPGHPAFATDPIEYGIVSCVVRADSQASHAIHRPSGSPAPRADCRAPARGLDRQGTERIAANGLGRPPPVLLACVRPTLPPAGVVRPAPCFGPGRPGVSLPTAGLPSGPGSALGAFQPVRGRVARPVSA